VYPIEIELPEVIDHIPPKCYVLTKEVNENGRERPMIKLSRLKCPYCNYNWIPRTPKPKRCPRCNNVIWRLLLLAEKDPTYARLLEVKKDAKEVIDG
jgi:hypothetical protein